MKLLTLSALFALCIFWTSFSLTAARTAPGPDGDQLFRSLNCAMCHGLNHQGTTLAPALNDMKKYWKKSALIEYLKDPMKMTKSDARLKKQKEQYPKRNMPSFSTLKPQQLNQLADWLLALK